jgi:hypothetical protein
MPAEMRAFFSLRAASGREAEDHSGDKKNGAELQDRPPFFLQVHERKAPRAVLCTLQP